jgi:WD40 repeat protein
MGNQLPIFNRLTVPSFDLSWLTIDDMTGEAYVLIPGGGGSTKSGVKNQIQIGRVIDNAKGGFELLKSYETDTEGKSVLCSGVAVGVCFEQTVVCTFLDNICVLLAVIKEPEESSLKFKRLTEFKADFSVDGSVNCGCILPSGHIVTGGDDGVCRLWAVTNKSDAWQIKMMSEMEGHTAPIMDIKYHPKGAMIATAAKDGSCKIWNILRG